VGNPIVFAFSDNYIEEKIMRHTKKFFSSGEVFVIGLRDEVRGTIAKIQANEGGLRLNRVNIYIVAAAENPEALSFAENAGERARENFCEIFGAVDITLVVLLDESNDCENVSERNANTNKFLTEFSARAFDKIFLISNKNEYGEIFRENNIYSLVAALPVINFIAPQFNEALAAKTATGKKIFASAGLWEKPPSPIDENFVLHKFAKIIEEEFNTESPEKSEKTRADFHFSTDSFSQCEIISNIASVAAKPKKFWELWGHSLKDAEKILFGDEAEKFFERNYFSKIISSDEIKIEKKLLRQTVCEETELRKIISETENKMRELKNRMIQAEAVICRLRSVDYVKNQIGETYALRYEYENLRIALERQKNELSRIDSYLDYIRGVVQTLKALPLSEISEPPEKNHEEPHAPIQISLLRNDGLIQETHAFRNINDDPCLLRIIGGFTLQDFRI